MSYWVVSPNLSPRTRISLAEWKRVITQKHVAIMGWESDHPIGRRFSEKVKDSDVILIARSHKGEPETVGFGVVHGEVFGASERRGKWTIKGLRTPGHYGFWCNLRPFVSLESPPGRIPLIDCLNHKSALAKLHPRRRRAHKRICDWMDSRLRLIGAEARRSRRIAGGGAKVVDVPANRNYGYEFSSKQKVVQATKAEARLVNAFRSWIWRNRRTELRAIRDEAIICDLYEEKRKNLIEAKSSVRLEDIRMAVGQLLHYAYQFRKDFPVLHLAVLLPQQPDGQVIDWLGRHQIGVVWRSGDSFADSAAGAFN